MPLEAGEGGDIRACRHKDRWSSLANILLNMNVDTELSNLEMYP